MKGEDRYPVYLPPQFCLIIVLHLIVRPRFHRKKSLLFALMPWKVKYYTELNDLRIITVELQWLEHLWDHENVFQTEVVRGNEC